MAHQIFAIRSAPHHSPLDVHAGNVLGGVGTELLPVLLVVMLNVPPPTVSTVVEEVAELQVLSAGFRPVFVVDTPTFTPFRTFAYPVELVIAEHDWTDSRHTWAPYLQSRLASIQRHFRCSGALILKSDGLGVVERAFLASQATDRRHSAT
jgi:hypothetical protein